MIQRFPARMRQIVILSDTRKRNLYNRFLLKLGFPILPIKLANIDRSQLENQTYLNKLADKVDLNTPEYQDLLAKHDSKLSQIRWFHFVVLFALFYSLLYYLNEGFVLYILLFFGSAFLTIKQFLSLLILGIFFLIILLMFLFNRRMIRATIRDVWKFLYEKYAESFCIKEIILILYLLKDKNNPIDLEDKKEDLSKRMLFLADTTKSIGERKASKYKGNKTRKKELKEHYQRMALAIEEREFWLYRPGDTTVKDISDYFKNLAHIYITGKFGNFQWQETQENNKTNLDKLKEAIALIKEAIPIINLVISILKAIWKLFFK
ncbi:MAG: hypothetical protein ACFBSE_23050 [Prochloraceae cyanobacterium]